jgi:hypothetical protein
MQVGKAYRLRTGQTVECLRMKANLSYPEHVYWTQGLGDYTGAHSLRADGTDSPHKWHESPYDAIEEIGDAPCAENEAVTVQLTEGDSVIDKAPDGLDRVLDWIGENTPWRPESIPGANRADQVIEVLKCLARDRASEKEEIDAIRVDIRVEVGLTVPGVPA